VRDQGPAMPNELIELTQVQITAGGIVGEGFKKLIGTNYIVSISQGLHDTSVITLHNGDKINVKESYDDLKRELAIT
jgi:hypothetical protein